MDVLLDANILFAAIIRDSGSRNLLVSEKLRLYAPEFILGKLEKYKDEILRKTQTSVADFEAVLAMLRRRIILVPLAKLAPRLGGADN